MMRNRSASSWTLALAALLGLGVAFFSACVPARRARPLAAVKPTAAEEALPVSRVVMFQNGVAYLERRGTFRGDALKLRVRPSQIQDILKSITVVDRSGGQANSLALPVDVSSERAMQELPKLALGQGSLAAILQALRGAEVRLETDDGPCEGRLVGLDPMGETGQRISVLDETGTVRIFPLAEVESFSILDPTLAQGLVKGLDISLGQEAWRSVELTIYLSKAGAKDRELLVAYLVEMPTWKSSYRLVLAGDEKPLLQGWAVIDNVSGADWRDVKLTLTTGSPVSFHYNLYTPRFVERPDLTPYRSLGIAPPVAVSAQATTPPADRWAEAEKKKRSSGEVASGLMSGRSRAARRPMAELATKADSYAGDELEVDEDQTGLDVGLLSDSVRVQATAQKVGSLYRFELAEPMTVPNRSSTMIALINQRIPGRAIYSYNPGSGAPDAARHPFRAVAIENAAGSVLEPGPLAIIRDGQYAGEGLIQRIEKGQRSYIAYALDTAVDVTHSQAGDHRVVGLVKISRGAIQTKAFSIQRYTWQVRASAEDGEALSMLVSLPKRAGWEVEAEGGELDSETADQRFYSMPVKPGGQTQLVVTEKYPTLQSYTIQDGAAQQALLLFVQDAKADPKILAQLKPLTDKVRALSDVGAQTQTLERKRSDLSQRANDIRANLKLLAKSRNEKLKAEQMGRLAKVDRQLAGLTDQLVALRDRAAQQRVELNELVEKLEIQF